MKCIKCIKQTKHYELDEIRRVDNQDADEKVASGIWRFIPKAEWKLATRTSKPEEIVITEVVEKVKSKKQLKKEKIKE